MRGPPCCGLFCERTHWAQPNRSDTNSEGGRICLGTLLGQARPGRWERRLHHGLGHRPSVRFSTDFVTVYFGETIIKTDQDAFGERTTMREHSEKALQVAYLTCGDGGHSYLEDAKHPTERTQLASETNVY